jgi:hypothetical protein
VSTDIFDLITRLTERQRMRFALGCARRVQHLMRDPRSVAALNTRERWLRGEATDEVMATAADAAWTAAQTGRHQSCAARPAARLAAWSAAAATTSATVTEWYAAWAADAAWAANAARAAERAWQRGELERMLREGGGA